MRNTTVIYPMVLSVLRAIRGILIALAMAIVGLIGRGTAKIVQRIAAERRRARLLTYISKLSSEAEEALPDFVNQSKHTLILNSCDNTVLRNADVMVSTCGGPGREVSNGNSTIPIDLWLVMVEATLTHHTQANTQSA